jgi:hypothetical protein
MNESQTKCAYVEDVEVEDFIRFVEYGYHNDFTIPKFQEDDSVAGNGVSMSTASNQDKSPGSSFLNGDALEPPTARNPYQVLPEVEPEVHPHNSFMDNHNPLWGFKPNMQRKDPFNSLAPPASPAPLTQLSLRTRLHKRTYLADGYPTSWILNRFTPRANTKADQNFTPVFVAYARLYTFANMQLVEPLKALVLHKLHRTLMDFQLYIKRVGDVIKLARHAYNSDHTPDRETDGTIDKLRSLVVEYIVCEIDTIGNCSEFMELLEDGGEFVSDFWSITRKYLIHIT